MGGCGTRRVIFSLVPTKIVASVGPLLALQRLRRLRQHLKHLREHRDLKVQVRGVAAHRLQRLVLRLSVKVMETQRVALVRVPGVREEVLDQVMLGDVEALVSRLELSMAMKHSMHRPASNSQSSTRKA